MWEGPLVSQEKIYACICVVDQLEKSIVFFSIVVAPPDVTQIVFMEKCVERAWFTLGFSG